MKNNKLNINKRNGFTFIEVLIVVAIIAVLAIGVIFFLSPAQLQSQGRDSNRVSDLTTLNQDIALYHETQPGGVLGTSSVVYVSIPDPTATTTAGTDCSGIGLVATGTTYHCASPSTYKLTNGTGWIPVNFNAVSSGNLLATLPVDPVNNTSTNEYYVYVTNGNQYEVLANPEAAKTIANSTTSFVQGNNLALLPNFPGTASTTAGGPAYISTAYNVGFQPIAGAFDSHTNTLWVTNPVGNTVLSINDTTFVTTTYSIASLNYPWGVAFDPHTNTIWVANNNGTTVTVINDTTATSTAVTVPSNPGYLAFDPNTNSVGVVQYGGYGITVINDTTFAKSTHSLPKMTQSIVFDSNINAFWIGSYNAPTVTRVNDTTFAYSTYIVAKNAVDDLAFDSHTNTVWVSDQGAGVVTVINDTTYTTSSAYNAYDGTNGNNWIKGIAFDPHTNSVWGTTVDGDAAVQINDTTYANSGSAPYYGAGLFGQYLVFDSHLNSIWSIPSYSNNTISQIVPTH